MLYKELKKTLYLRRRFIDIQIIICEFVFSNSNLGLSLQNEITFIGFIGGRTCICYCSFLVRLSKPWIPRISSKAFQIFPSILDCTFSDIYLEVARLSPGGCISGPCLLDPCHRIWIFVFCWIQVLVFCWFRIFFPVGFGSLFFVGSSSSSFVLWILVFRWNCLLSDQGPCLLLNTYPCFSLELDPCLSLDSGPPSSVPEPFLLLDWGPCLSLDQEPFLCWIRILFFGSNSRHWISIFVFWWIQNFFFWLIGIELDF